MPRLFTLLLLSLAFIVKANAQDYKRLTNLPHMYINTYGGVGITSKTVYVYSKIVLVTEDDEVEVYDSVAIRGRGNSTWNMSKKPYRIKFPSKQKFLGKGYAKAKSWTLLANAGDKTLIRNAITSEMGNFLGLKFNPAAKFIDLTLNGVYLGNYQISDHVDVRPHRVDIIEQDLPLNDDSDITGGYLFEVDGFKDGNCFTTAKGQVPIRIHYPDDEDIKSSQNLYARAYMRDFETVLFSDDFADADKGYRRWVDSTSLVNWFIATEVSANIDGYYSTYFYKNQGDSLLYWGPLWDYDIAYDNDQRIPGNVEKLMTDVGYGQTKVWVNRMWEDPWFGKLVVKRYNQAVADGLENYLYQKIDSLTNLLSESQELNYEKWGISRKMYHEIVLYSSYDQYVNDLKQFITGHMAYLQEAFPNKKIPEPTPPFSPEHYYYRITNAKTNTAIDLCNQAGEVDEEYQPEDNDVIVGWANSQDRLSQEWQIKPVGDYFMIINRLGNMALTDLTQGEVSATTNVGTQLQISAADSLDNRQLWILTPQGIDNYYNITNLYTQHTANLSGGNASNGTSVVSYTTDERNSSSTNRLWYFTPSSPLPDEPEPEPDLTQIRIKDNPDEILEYVGRIGEDFDTALDSLRKLKNINSDITKEPLEVIFDFDDRQFFGIVYGDCAMYSDVLDTFGNYYLRSWSGWVDPNGMKDLPVLAEYALAYNPVTKELHFASEDPSQLNFAANILTLDGRKVSSFNASERHSVADLPQGTYIIRWNENGRQRATKFLR